MIPTDSRAGVCAAVTSGAAPRCAHIDRFGWRCMNPVQVAGSVCFQHQRQERMSVLPDELVVLRDPRTGEPMEVG